MKYFNLGDAFDEIKGSIGGKDMAFAGAKLIGKTIFNAGKYVVEEGLSKQAERVSEEALKRDDITPEQREKAEELNKKAKRSLLTNEIKNLEEELVALQGKEEKIDAAESLRRKIDRLKEKLNDL